MAKASRTSKKGSISPKASRPSNRSSSSTSNCPDIATAEASSSKQARVIAMLRSTAGTTIAAMMQATGWQQHSVRGFLAGVVRRKLKLKLDSKQDEAGRVYRVLGGRSSRAGNREPKRAAA
jgi:hypothetical protein